MTTVDPRFAAATARLMQERGTTGRHLAKAANVSPSYLSEILNGHKMPSASIAESLDGALRAEGVLVDLFVDVVTGTQNDEPHCVYRFYDGADRLLYVGAAYNPGVRWYAHEAGKPWWTAVARATIEHHPNRPTALLAEKHAIRTEGPLHNVVHSLEQATRRRRSATRRIGVDARFAPTLTDCMRRQDCHSAELSRKTGVSQSFISEIRHGLKMPSLQVAKTFDVALGTDGQLAEIVRPPEGLAA